MTNLDVAYIPTPKNIVRQMLLLARLRRGEILYDLGAGDGRILIEGTRDFGARCVGVEIDHERVTRLRKRLATTRVEARIIERDLMQVDLSEADVIAIYLSESVNARLAPKLSIELKTGARVVSLDYPLPGWKLEKEVSVPSSGLSRQVYLYSVRKSSERAVPQL
ncbi:MAG TPA: methyltransferase domain-containing protein [Methylomirabilota bacterium]|nr:methyltransferase domain-containing protein [Methylomirabilota bacterium]